MYFCALTVKFEFIREFSSQCFKEDHLQPTYRRETNQVDRGSMHGGDLTTIVSLYLYQNSYNRYLPVCGSPTPCCHKHVDKVIWRKSINFHKLIILTGIHDIMGFDIGVPVRNMAGQEHWAGLYTHLCFWAIAGDCLQAGNSGWNIGTGIPVPKILTASINI